MKIINSSESKELVSIPIKVVNSSYSVKTGTVFGVVVNGSASVKNRQVFEGEFFCRTAPLDVVAEGLVALFIKTDWVGKNVVAGEVGKEKGDVNYIDGCTDSLLVCPPRLGDPCLNALYFPQNTTQTFHTHPSVRLGVVLNGEGLACLEDQNIQLKKGTVFQIDVDEVHRFITEDSSMVVIAYHPDSDWGPTDQQHPMINKTIIQESKCYIQ